MRVALVLVLCVAACKKEGGGNEAAGPLVRFRDTSDIGKLTALTAAIGGGVTFSRSGLSDAEQDSIDYGCPTKEETADGLSYTGGCTTDEDDAYGGSVQTRNLDNADPNAPVEADFSDWSTPGTSADGTFSIGPYDAEGQLVEADLDAHYYGLHLGFGGAMRCAPLCKPEGELIGWFGDGSFEVDGEWNQSGSMGWLELTGKDVLRIDDLTPFGTGGCAPYTLDGEDAGELCL